MATIRITKAFHQFDKGEVVDMANNIASGLVNGGWAEYYEKPKPKKRKSNVNKSSKDNNG